MSELNNWNGATMWPNNTMPRPTTPYTGVSYGRCQVIKVKGEAGAKNIRMGPNSSILLLDETAPIIWYAQTDGTGYLTVTPFDYSPHRDPAQVSIDNHINELTERVKRLEDAIANVVQQSYSGTGKTKKRQQPTAGPEGGANFDAANIAAVYSTTSTVQANNSAT